jgi:hypothetical protein
MAKEKPQRGIKSQAIRELLQQNRRMKTRDVVATLGERGIQVTPNLVYLAKSKMRQRRRKQKREELLANSRKAGITNPLDFLVKVKLLANDAGGIRKLKQFVDIMAE